MRMVAAIAFAILLPTSATAASQKDAWQDCLDTGFDMKGCSLRELERIDPILESSYRAALARETVYRDRLVTVQKAWEEFSESECIYAFSTAGPDTLSYVFEKGCRVVNTRRRIDGLSQQGMQKLGRGNPASEEFKKCFTGSTKRSVLEKCLSAELVRNDRNLDAIYLQKIATAEKNDKSLSDQDARERDSLVLAEATWIAFRNAQCGYLAERQRGQDIRLTDLRCRSTMTVQRIADLADGP